MYAYASLHCSSMEHFEIAQIPGDHQISDGLDEGELLEHLRNAPIFSPPRSPRFLDGYYLQLSPDFFGLQFGSDTSLPPYPTDSVSPDSPPHHLGTTFHFLILLGSSTENVHQAALRLQKVYKSFRTRRKLADCAVLVEQIWSKTLDFAELMQSSISFFDIDKAETAVSRWSRARTRAAKVGKGLSKDQGARKLAVQHCLEELRLLLNMCSLEEETSVEIINPSMDEKLDSSQLDPSEQQVCVGFDVTKSGYKTVSGDMSCAAICHSHTNNAMETPESKCATKREITIKDLQPLFDVSVSTFKRHCRRNGIKWENVNECSQALELDPKHRETPGEKTTPSCKTPSITGRAETGNQVLDNRIVEIEGNLQEQNCFQTDNVSKEELRLQLNRCSLEEETSVEIINPSMEEKLDSRQLDPSEQQVCVGFDVTKNGYKTVSGDMSCAAICHSNTNNAMETPKRKCATKCEITIKDLQPLFGRKRAEAAKILGVSVSTFKRHCRFNGIKWWNGGECSRAFELDPKHRETPGEKTTPSCKTPSITGRAETENQVLDSSIVDIEGNLQEQNSFQTENVSKEVEGAVSEGDSNSSWPMLPYSDPTPKQSVVTVKATYGEDTVKFDLSSTPKIVELKEEVAKRLELESGSFKVKYQDADQEWILIACDADFQQCLRLSSSLGNPLIRLLVIDKVFNFGKSSKRCRR